MKQPYFYASFLSIGLLAFAANSYAELDCNDFVYSTATFEACNTLNQTVTEAKKADESRFEKLHAQKQTMQKNATPPARQVQTNPALQNQPAAKSQPQSQPPKNVFPEQNTEAQPSSNDIGSMPSANTSSTSETMPEVQPPNSAPNSEQKSNRIKYY